MTDANDPTPWLIDGATEAQIHDALAAHAARWLHEVGVMLEADGFPPHVAEAVLVKVQPIVERHCERHLPDLLAAAGCHPALRH